MLGRKNIELLDKIAKRIRNNCLPFGGIQVIFSGDFLQLPPVNDEFSFTSKIWDELDFKYYVLSIPYRYPDIEYFYMLQRIRIGKPTPDDIKKLKNRVDVYIDYVRKGLEKKETIKPTSLFSMKKDVEKLNLDELKKLPGDPICYNSIDNFSIDGNEEKKEQGKKQEELTKKEVEDYTDYLNNVIPKQLLFKPGAQVMLTYNLSLELGLANGSRGVVKSCEHDGVLVTFKNGLTIKIVYNPYEQRDRKVKMIRYQIPLILAWSTSIHRAQGCTLDHAKMDLGTSIFAPGMSYVALSRIRSLDGVLLTSFIQNKITADPDALEFEDMMMIQQEIQMEHEGKDTK